MNSEAETNTKKSHRERRAGRKAEKKKEKNKHVQELSAQQRNPKAFAFNSIVKTQRKIARSEDLKARKQHIPVVNRTPLEPPPVLVAVVGGCKVGKSTLVRSLIKNYSKQKLSTIEGPVTVVAGKKHRLTFLEVKNDINCMVDVAKIADVVLMMIDITLGLEMEILEFLEICRAYGTPRVIGVLNHLDLMKNNKGMRKRKKDLTHRFQNELSPGTKLFYLTGVIHGEYVKGEISNLARFISVLKFRPLQFRLTHPYVLVDRIEDITNAETVRVNPVCRRNVVLYGYVRGIPLQPGQNIHIPGVGDFRLKDVNILDDPCPLPGMLKKRSLNSKERHLYAPMSGVAGVIYDKDAIYIDLGGSQHHRSQEGEENDGENIRLLDSLLRKEVSSTEEKSEKGVKAFSISNITVFNSESEESEEDEVRSERNDDRNSLMLEEVIGSDGRKRRKAVFQEEDEEQLTESGIESDENGSEEEDTHYGPPNKRLKKDDTTSIAEESETQNKLFRRPPGISGLELSNLPGMVNRRIISTRAVAAHTHEVIYRNGSFGEQKFEDDNGENEDNDNDDLFKPMGTGSCQWSNLPGGVEFNGSDLFKNYSALLGNTSDKEVTESIGDCFVTGEWSEKESAQKLLQLDDEDEDLYGDFEDLETGTKFLAENEDGNISDKETSGPRKEDKTTEEKRREKKKRLKEFFDSEYDDKSNGEYFDTLKAEMNEQAEINRTQFEGLSNETRVQFEGFRAGLYVRMELEDLDSEFITNFNPSYPVIVGGLLNSELAMGYIRARMKVHRWFPRILKNADPLYFSLGWRRFQSMVFYAKREDNFRLRSLKYARKYLHVEAIFWGPITEISTGFVAIQDINQRTSDFSIAASGVVLEADQTTNLVKKLKLIGHPDKIYQKTAFIKDMFHSDTEVVKFEGVKIKTQSSVRGVIKKAIGLNGQYRATFEDSIKLSDTVFLTTWVCVEVPKCCFVVKNLLLSLDRKSDWPGMKTNAQIKREKAIKHLPNPDCLYKEIRERREYIPLPMKIPRQLQASLPYKDKPKVKGKVKKPNRVVVVKDPEEVKMQEFMDRLKILMKDKKSRQEKEKREKKEKYVKELQKKEELRKMREKKRKAFSCKMKSVKKNKTL